MIGRAQGKRARILQKKTNLPHPKLVCVLGKGNRATASQSFSIETFQLQQEINSTGYDLRCFFIGPIDIGPTIQRVRQLVEENPAACWVVYSGNPKLQKFFQNCGLPTLLRHLPAPDISLPYMCLNDDASCQHAVGGLRALGHRKIALLVGETPTQAHAQLCGSFLAAMEEQPGENSRPQVISYSPLKDNLWQRLGEAFDNTDRDPAALIIHTTMEAMSALSFFFHHKIEVPRHGSLVCLHFNHLLSHWKPRISAYDFNQEAFYREAAQLIIQLAKFGKLPKNAYPYLPEYQGGQTMVRPRDAVSREL